MSDRILTDADCLAIVQASIAPDRMLGGPDGETPDVLLTTVEQIVAEHTQALRDEAERWRRIVTDAALETYTPDGSEIVVSQLHEYARRAEAAEAEVRRLREGIEALVVEIERPYEASPRRRREWADRLRALLDGGDQ